MPLWSTCKAWMAVKMASKDKGARKEAPVVGLPESVGGRVAAGGEEENACPQWT